MHTCRKKSENVSQGIHIILRIVCSFLLLSSTPKCIMKKTQIGWAFILIIGVILAYSFLKPSGFQSAYILQLILVVVLILFYRLTIEVDDEYVHYIFGIGLIKGKFKLKDIVECKSVSYLPLGWGVRYRPGVILYNVSGRKAIELVVKNKDRKVWIGTDNPEEIVEYIQKKIGK